MLSARATQSSGSTGLTLAYRGASHLAGRWLRGKPERMLHDFKFKLSSTQLGISQHAISECKWLAYTQFEQGWRQHRGPLHTGHVCSWWSVGSTIPVYARGAVGVLGIPTMWEWSPETCASCARGSGLSGGCWWEARNKFWLLSGQLLTASAAGGGHPQYALSQLFLHRHPAQFY